MALLSNSDTEVESGARLLARAREKFGIGGESRRRQWRKAAETYYVPNLALLTRSAIGGADDGHTTLIDPISVLLPDSWVSGFRADDVPSLSLPYVMVVVGQYGVGKTELIHQLGAEAERLRDDPSRKLKVLPVALTDCRAEFDSWRQSPALEAAPRMLLGHLLDEKVADLQLEWLTVSARAGELIIALDAVDELISEPDAYEDFLTALRAFVQRIANSSGEGRPKIRLIVTMRLEFLQSAGDARGNRITGRLRPAAERIAIYFMRFEIMGEADTLSYLEARLRPVVAGSESVTTLLEDHPDIFRMLQRPLLARIFCDLCEQNHLKIPAVVARLQKQPDLTTLVASFVELATDDPDLLGEQQLIQGARLIPKSLADRTAQLYRNSKHGFEMADVTEFVELQGSGEPDEDEDSRYLSGLHKCPFLVVDVQHKRADFAHRIFEEYFTALGLWQSQKVAEESRKSGKVFPLFDEIVLNVDMRKLLKGIVVKAHNGCENAWYKETRHSYGLEESETWESTPLDSQLPIDDLDRVRCRILDIMTEADGEMRERHVEIREFLHLMQHHFHPRYAIFNYEGIAVYIFLFSYLEPEASRISDSFSDHLRDRLALAFDRLEPGPSGRSPATDTRPYELLIERILSVALRLNYSWMTDHPARSSQFNLIKGDDVRNRINALIERYGTIDLNPTSTLKDEG